jgi:hypothetical protein
VSRVHIIREEIAELKRCMAENAEVNELRQQIAAVSSSVKGKTLKITPEVLGLSVKPICGNCSKKNEGPGACYISISWSTQYNPTIIRSLASCMYGILREGEGPAERTENPIITLPPGDRIIVQTASFICDKQFIRKGCPLADLHCGKYHNDVKNFVQGAFNRLCSEVSQPLETSSTVNMDEYMDKYTEWVKGGLAHACNEAVNISSLMNARKYKEYYINPPTYVKNLPVIPLNKEFRLVNKITNCYLHADYKDRAVSSQSKNHEAPPGHTIWTLEPVN